MNPVGGIHAINRAAENACPATGFRRSSRQTAHHLGIPDVRCAEKRVYRDTTMRGTACFAQLRALPRPQTPLMVESTCEAVKIRRSCRPTSDHLANVGSNERLLRECRVMVTKRTTTKTGPNSRRTTTHKSSGPSKFSHSTSHAGTTYTNTSAGNGKYYITRTERVGGKVKRTRISSSANRKSSQKISRIGWIVIFIFVVIVFLAGR